MRHARLRSPDTVSSFGRISSLTKFNRHNQLTETTIPKRHQQQEMNSNYQNETPQLIMDHQVAKTPAACRLNAPPPTLKKSAKAMKPLPPDFVPSNYSIFCGRGKGSYNACGNRRFRVIVGIFLDQYAEAEGCPAERSQLVNKVMNIIKECCPVGTFIKRVDGRYFELPEKAAREKCSSLFRDCWQASTKGKRLVTKGDTKKQSCRLSLVVSANSDADRRDSAKSVDSVASSVAASIGSFFTLILNSPCP